MGEEEEAGEREHEEETAERAVEEREASTGKGKEKGKDKEKSRREREKEREEMIRNLAPSPSRDLALLVEASEKAAEEEDVLRRRSAEEVACGSEVSEWEWCRKKVMSNGARGSAPYHPWWGLFMDTVPLGKRHATEDVRFINKVAPGPSQPVGKGGGASAGQRNKAWLQVGKYVEAKWDGEWWQAKIKKVKTERGSEKVDKVFIAYVGGTADDNEWVPLSSRRLRPPTDDFQDTSRGT